MSHVTCMNESCHMYEWVMSHVWMSHVTCMNESYHKHSMSAWKKIPMCIHKRDIYMYIFFKKTYVYVNRGLYIYMWKETYIYKSKESYVYVWKEKYACIKRDLYKETDMCVKGVHVYARDETYTYVSKETYKCEKRPICVQRDPYMCEKRRTVCAWNETYICMSKEYVSYLRFSNNIVSRSLFTCICLIPRYVLVCLIYSS